MGSREIDYKIGFEPLFKFFIFLGILKSLLGLFPT